MAYKAERVSVGWDCDPFTSAASYSDICWNHGHLTRWCILDYYKTNYWCQIHIRAKESGDCICGLSSQHWTKPHIVKSLALCVCVCLTPGASNVLSSISNFLQIISQTVTGLFQTRKRSEQTNYLKIIFLLLHMLYYLVLVLCVNLSRPNIFEEQSKSFRRGVSCGQMERSHLF